MNAVFQVPKSPSRTLQRWVLAGLLALALGMLALTDGPWQWSGSPTRMTLAVLFSAAFAALWKLNTLTTTTHETSPTTTHASAANDHASIMPVFFASQTGTAEMLARQTAEALSKAGLTARACALDDIDRVQLESTPRALFIASTTDEGDPPYPVAGFVRQVLDGAADLGALQFGLLALGDSYYETFCGFGRRLDAWLIEQGATPLFARIDVDDNDPAALAVWNARMVELAGSALSPADTTPSYRPWRIKAREELNPGSLGEPVFRLDLVPADGALPTWQAGDIAVMLPRHAKATIDAWLAQAGLDGEARLGSGTHPETLRERLAKSELPALDAVRGRSPEQVGESLIALRSRDYSIASLAADGRIELLIRQGRRPDGQVSLGAAWLTRDTTIGDCIDLRLRSNVNFRAPDDAAPLILIGNGTGLAGLRSLLRERIAHGRLRNWLVFGERQRERDFYYGDELERALAKGQLAHLDLAFSRDSAERRYVQHLLDEQAVRLHEWVKAGATICVCGSQEGMATAVDASLRRSLGDARVQAMIEAGRYRRDVY